MKKTVMVSVLMALALSVFAGNVSERVYVTTDRRVYVAGDRVWCSAFCLDAASGCRISDLSSIAYLELHSMDGMALTHRIALRDGRGAAAFVLPYTLPTGNYKIMAYTAMTLAETGVDHASAAGIISVINPSGTARVKGGVTVTDSPVPAAVQFPDSGPLSVDMGAPEGRNLALTISNPYSSAATLSVSLYHDDGLEEPSAVRLPQFRALSVPGRKVRDVVPEYDGEIIHAHVAGLDEGALAQVAGSYAFISVPGDRADVYSSQIAPDGTATFYTSNIYGMKDMLCELESLSRDARGHLEIDSPFAGLPAGDIPALNLRPAQADAIVARKAAAAVASVFEADTLYDRLPARFNHLFGEEAAIYRLDDYTRFPLMREVITEFIPELRVRKGEDGADCIQVRLKDSFDFLHFSQDRPFVLLDGVPVFDHARILEYDPLLVESINVYPYVYNIGARYFNGVVDMITYKRNLPSMTFNDNVTVYSYDGASVPKAYTCKGLGLLGDTYPDMRQTAFWHPVLDIASGGDAQLQCVLPQYPGNFRLVVEGILEDGTPVFMERRLTVQP